MKEKLYIVDISNFIHRAAHAMSDLSTKEGFPTGAIYGTFSMLSTFMAKYKPKYMLICYDWAGADSVRKTWYANYKSNREKKDNISAQELLIRRIISLLNIPSIEVPGWEADDLIASAVGKFKHEFDIEILTGDKDLMQLVENGVILHDTMKNIRYSINDVYNKYGVYPHQIVDYLAIMGDKVDCIPGIYGIGKVGACSLLKSFSSIEDIYNNIEFITDRRLLAKLHAGKESAFISKKLANLNPNLIDDNFVLKKINPISNDELVRLFNKLEFDNGLIKLLQLWSVYK